MSNENMASEEEQSENQTHEPGRKVQEFYKLIDHPVYAQVANKSGCTFIKNLFYYLNTGRVHPLGNKIHRCEDQLLRGHKVDIPEIEASPYVFMLIRNPVNRFFSLYFDKIINNDDGFHWFREQYGYDIGMKFDEDLSFEAHRDNLSLLIDFIEDNLKSAEIKDPHWAPQNSRYWVVRKFDPVLLPLEDASEALTLFLGDEVPNISEAVYAVKAQNRSRKPYPVNQLRNWPLTKRIRQVYARDMKLSSRARKNFEQLKAQSDSVKLHASG